MNLFYFAFQAISAVILFLMSLVCMELALEFLRIWVRAR